MGNLERLQTRIDKQWHWVQKNFACDCETDGVNAFYVAHLFEDGELTFTEAMDAISKSWKKLYKLK